MQYTFWQAKSPGILKYNLLKMPAPLALLPVLAVPKMATILAAGGYLGGAATAYEIGNEIKKYNEGVSHWNSAPDRSAAITQDFIRGCADGSITSKDCPQESNVGKQVGEQAENAQNTANFFAQHQGAIVIGVIFVLFLRIFFSF